MLDNPKLKVKANSLRNWVKNTKNGPSTEFDRFVEVLVVHCFLDGLRLKRKRLQLVFEQGWKLQQNYRWTRNEKAKLWKGSVITTAREGKHFFKLLIHHLPLEFRKCSLPASSFPITHHHLLQVPLSITLGFSTQT